MSSQADRDFIVTLCLTSKGYHIVMVDRVGQIETDLIPFSNSAVFLRLVMGLAFLPDSYIGRDSIITREAGKSSNIKFTTLYPHFIIPNPKPSINFRPAGGLFTVKSVPTSASETSGSIYSTSSSTSLGKSLGEISTISIGPNIYKVIRVLFKSKGFIGRATTVF